jgi:hypothetical protein
MSINPEIKRFLNSNGNLSNPFENINPNEFNTMWIQNPEKKSNFIYDIIKKDDAHGKKYSYQFKDEYHILNHIPPERITKGKEDWEVEYSFNNELFRSDHFTKDHDGMHILFGGCSNTEGVGSNITDNWSYLLHQEISKSVKTSGFFSVAKGGYGWHQIFLNFKIYVEKYGAPEYYFVLHPNIVRFYKWNEELGDWRYIQRNSGETYKQEEYDEHRLVFPNWVSAMSLFIAYCESVGTKLIWTTWDNRETNNIKNSGYFDSTYFETYFGTPANVQSIRPDGNFEKDDINFRDGHPGKVQQILWFQSFKDELIKRKEIFK